jgi:hypothetical protein
MSESEMHEDPTSKAANISGILNFIYDYRELKHCSALPKMARDECYPLGMKAYKGE